MAENAHTTHLCRDCFTWAYSSKVEGRCNACGSPRIVHHGEITQLAIAHLDCDAFYAAVEKRDNPELADKPVIIGGGERGVVSTACYNARIYGVHSAQPMFKALKACPDAVVIRPNMEKYSKVGREIRSAMFDLTPMVEPLSIDEAFLDLSGTERLHGMPPAETLARFVDRIQRDIGITISIGLSFNKFLAKVASDLEKPRGFSVIGEAGAVDFLKDQPVRLIWGVGKAMQRKLAEDGIRTIGDLQALDENALGKTYGTIGLRLARLAHAHDTRPVSPEREAKSISSETTFRSDIGDYESLAKILLKLSEKVSRQLKAKELSGQTIVLKLKSDEFKIRTRNRRLADPTQLSDRIFRTACALLDPEIDGTLYRLIGVGVSDLQSEDLADPLDLIDEDATKRAGAERAIDQVRAKFGNEAVTFGRLFDGDKK
ncbi:MAG: DNA polymerase IV [Pseudomonadota bacterium]